MVIRISDNAWRMENHNVQFETHQCRFAQATAAVLTANPTLVGKSFRVKCGVEVLQVTPKALSWTAWAWSFIPMFEPPPNPTLQRMTVASDRSWIPEFMRLAPLHGAIEAPNLTGGHDDWLRLAATAFQTVETFYTAQVEHSGAYAYIKTAVGLKLVPRTKAPQNSDVAKAFERWAVIEYGQDFVDYAKFAYDLKFDGPLLPDHVFKLQIGVHNVQVRHVQSLYERLRDGGELSEREKRRTSGISLPWSKPKNARDLPPDLYNKLVSVFFPENWDDIFVGRKITHTAIMGYRTQGNKDERDKCLDLFELLHTFPDLKTHGRKHFYEILAHVAMKKHLWREHEDHVGMGVLIPSSDGWYSVDIIYDDTEGDTNYFLRPAAHQSIAPNIKLYRSTASDSSNVNGISTINADLNPNDSPGSLRPQMADDYERTAIHASTIPTYVAYLIAGDKDKARKEFDKQMAECKRIGMPCTEEEDADIQAFARKHNEWPDQKKRRDLIFVGHSLGGALAQFGAAYFLPKEHRLPIPGCNIEVVAYDAPGIDREDHEKFWAYMDDHKEVLQGSQVVVRHHLEAKSVISLAGQDHLGNIAGDDEPWSKVKFRLYQRTDTPASLDLRTAPCHGGRWRLSEKVRDFVKFKFTPEEWRKGVDRALVMSADIRAKFQFGTMFSRSSVLLEVFRRVAGTIYYPIGQYRQDLNKKSYLPESTKQKDGSYVVSLKLDML